MKAIDQAIIKSIQDRNGTSFYVNVAQMRNGEWIVCWDERFFGHCYRRNAVQLRRTWFEHLKKNSRLWKKTDLRTIKVL